MSSLDSSLLLCTNVGSLPNSGDSRFMLFSSSRSISIYWAKRLMLGAREGMAPFWAVCILFVLSTAGL